MASLKKNVASQNIAFVLINASTGAAVTGVSVAGKISKDGGSQAAIANVVSELGVGQYNYVPSQSETNATEVGVIFSATNAIPTNLTFFTDLVDANNFIKVDLEDIAGSTLSTASAQIGVNVVNIAASTAVASASVTFPATIASPTNISSGNITTVTNLTNAPTAGDLTATMKTSVQTAAASAISASVPLAANVTQINSSATSAQALQNSTQSICWGTATSGTISTVVASSINNPASLTDVNQLNGRTIIFLGNTTTANIRAEASNITASTTGSTPTITFTAITTAPANGDTFVIV